MRCKEVVTARVHVSAEIQRAVAVKRGRPAYQTGDDHHAQADIQSAVGQTQTLVRQQVICAGLAAMSPEYHGAEKRVRVEFRN
eukprot:440076-Pyramimonas_sp.AAC.1